MDTVSRIEALIKEKGWSNSEFCRRLDMSVSTVSDWKQGKSQSYKKMIARIAEVLGTTVDYLNGETDNPSREAHEGAIDSDVIKVASALLESGMAEKMADMNDEERKKYIDMQIGLIRTNADYIRGIVKEETPE